MKKLFSAIATMATVAAGQAFAHGPPLPAYGPHGYVYNSGEFTFIGQSLNGINNNGSIVGFTEVDPESAFSDIDGVFNTIVDPDGDGASPNGINDANVIVGYFTVKNSDHYSGFIDSGGIYTTLDVPGAVGTYAYGIDNLGEVSGTAEMSRVGSVGFTYINGIYSLIRQPGAYDTVVLGINNLGVVVGLSSLGSFEYQNGVFSSVGITEPFAINDKGDIAGINLGPHGDLAVAEIAGVITPIEPPRSGYQHDALAYGINNADDIVGGFIAVPEPAAWMMMLVGVAMIGFAARRRREGATLAA